MQGLRQEPPGMQRSIRRCVLAVQEGLQAGRLLKAAAQHEVSVCLAAGVAQHHGPKST